MTADVCFLVLCSECPLDEVHNDLARARRSARDHVHAGVTVISLAAIRGNRAHPSGTRRLGWLFTSTAPRWLEQQAARTPSRIRRLLARSAIA